MKCREFTRWLDAYWDQTLAQEQYDRMQAHARRCPSCREKLHQYQLMRDALAQEGKEQMVLPAVLHETVMSRVTGEKARRMAGLEQADVPPTSRPGRKGASGAGISRARKRRLFSPLPRRLDTAAQSGQKGRRRPLRYLVGIAACLAVVLALSLAYSAFHSDLAFEGGFGYQGDESQSFAIARDEPAAAAAGRTSGPADSADALPAAQADTGEKAADDAGNTEASGSKDQSGAALTDRAEKVITYDRAAYEAITGLVTEKEERFITPAAVYLLAENDRAALLTSRLDQAGFTQNGETYAENPPAEHGLTCLVFSE